MKAKPAKKTRKSLKVKYITNEDIPKYMKAEDYEDHEEHSDEEHHEVVPNVQQPEYFDDSSNKCDIDTAEAHDIISDSDEQRLAEVIIDCKSEIEKPVQMAHKALPLKRKTTGNKQTLNNLDSEGAFFDIFEEPVVKKQKVEDENRFVNYKETDSQIADKQSHIDVDLMDYYPFGGLHFDAYEDNVNDDTFVKLGCQGSNPFQEVETISVLQKNPSHSFRGIRQHPLDDIEITSYNGAPRDPFSFIFN